jgi:hypothetical protein
MSRLHRVLPAVFVASSSEGEPVAARVARAMARFARPQLWTVAFTAGGMTLPTLVERAKTVDFGVIVATADDLVEKRGEAQLAARDNVLFEAGLFVGVLGAERTLIVHPVGLDLPSDLLGFTTVPYVPGKRLDKTVADLRRTIERLGRRGHVTVGLTLFGPQPSSEAPEVRLAGTLKALHPLNPDWEPGVALERLRGAPPRWWIRLEAPEGTELAYKYMAGPPWDWSHVESLENGDERENRTLVFRRGGSRVHEDFVERWR